MTKKALIVTAQTKIDFSEFSPQNTIFIGVEKGALDLISKQIPLNWAVGDFDKVNKEEFNLIQKKLKFF